MAKTRKKTPCHKTPACCRNDETVAALQNLIKTLGEEVERLRQESSCSHDLLLDVCPPDGFGDIYRCCVRCGHVDPWALVPHLHPGLHPPHVDVTLADRDVLLRAKGRDLITFLSELYRRAK